MIQKPASGVQGKINLVPANIKSRHHHADANVTLSTKDDILCDPVDHIQMIEKTFTQSDEIVVDMDIEHSSDVNLHAASINFAESYNSQDAVDQECSTTYQSHTDNIGNCENSNSLYCSETLADNCLEVEFLYSGKKEKMSHSNSTFSATMKNPSINHKHLPKCVQLSSDMSSSIYRSDSKKNMVGLPSEGKMINVFVKYMKEISNTDLEKMANQYKPDEKFIIMHQKNENKEVISCLFKNLHDFDPNDIIGAKDKNSPVLRDPFKESPKGLCVKFEISGISHLLGVEEGNTTIINSAGSSYLSSSNFSLSDISKNIVIVKDDKLFFIYNVNNPSQETIIKTYENDYSCHFCRIDLHGEDVIKSHIRSHVQDGAWVCHLCKMPFKFVKRMAKHYLSVHKSNIACGVTDMSFQSLKIYSFQFNVLVMNEAFYCSSCGTTFEKMNQLCDHIVLKLSCSKLLSCHICEEKFAYRDSLVNHLTRVHKNQEIIPCRICGYSLNKSCWRDKHELTHDKDNAFRCHLCSFSSAHWSDFSYHILHNKKHRSQFRGQTCPECTVVLRNVTEYLAHIKELHSEKLLCLCCKKENLSSVEELSEHALKHSIHGWTDEKVPGLEMFNRVMSYCWKGDELGTKSKANDIITVTDTDGEQIQFTPDTFLPCEDVTVRHFNFSVDGY